MDEFSASEAAAVLGVSRVQIGRLIASDELEARRFGRAWAIDRESVYRYASLHPGAGRPLGPRAAWTQLLHTRPASLSEVEHLAVICRRRARRVGAWVPSVVLSELLEDERVVPTGVVAAARLGASVDERPPFQLYVRRGDWDAMQTLYRVDQQHSAPNVVFRIAPDDAPVFHDHLPRWVVVAIDLVAEREHRVAAELMKVAR